MQKRIHPEEMGAIGQRIAMVRQAMRLTPSAFARRLGVEPQSIYQWENGLKRPDISNALEMCRKTGVTLDWIYRGIQLGMPGHLEDEFDADQYAALSA